MEREVVEEAVKTLQQQGLPLTEITAPKVREVLGSGSYRDITKHLRALKGEDLDAGVEESLPDGSSEAFLPDSGRNSLRGRPSEPATEDTGGDDAAQAGQGPEFLDAASKTPPDLITAAEDALTQAQAQLVMAETQLPALEDALAEAKRHMLAQVGLAEAVRVAVIPRGLLRHDDPAVGEAETAVKMTQRAFEDAQWALTQAQQQVSGWRQVVQQAKARLSQVKRDGWLQAHHPDLWEARQRLAADPRATGPGRADYLRWKWDKGQVEAQISQVLQAAEV